MSIQDHSTPQMRAFQSLTKNQRSIRIRVFESLAGRTLSDEDRHILLFQTAPILDNQESFESVLESIILKKEIIKPSQEGLF